ncbi:tRNA (adenosine(37)-N6)-dimethylallyltransferase MiaA [Fructobacillus ficulneus]|uniref:tRNA dimethylallyltransferase n=1 Tax=Fructobacillus ficulneus TaxID=157463 RepID=A0A0K8MHI8_9LACO|nr:tRNA (adenosine(37)-N6)-dimethylallyltransferase MiaA [Fructobacillus ficulneus]GAP00001.1 tRNA dimethylallyltransferase [Fructobacillus ficulneus]
MQSIPIIVIAGPTASGKSDLALAIAKKYNGEIVSADSMQVYKQLDIGTAKTPVVERDGISHHLLDLCEPTEEFSVANFIDLADQAIEEISAAGKVPVIVGGTGFYVKALLGFQPLDYAKSNPEEVAAANLKSIAELQAELKNLADQDFISHVDLNNRARLVRATQIAKNGRTERPARTVNYNPLVLAPDWPREVLYDRINRRVGLMVDQGLEAEARLLFDLGGRTIQAGRGIGYAEFYPYFEGQATLDEVVSQIQQNSRRYAKRQLTYWRHQIPGLQWIDGRNALSEADQAIADFKAMKETKHGL